MCRSNRVKLAPIEIEGDGIRFDIGFEDVLELVECDRSRAITVGHFRLYLVTAGRRAEENARTCRNT